MLRPHPRVKGVPIPRGIGGRRSQPTDQETVASMDPSFVRLSHPRDTGIFTAAEAVQAGFSVGEIQTLVRKRHLERLAIGTYVDRDRWQEADLRHRHVLTTVSRCLTLSPEKQGHVALSHESAAAWWQPPLLRTPHRGHLVLGAAGPASSRRAYTIHRRYGPPQRSRNTGVDAYPTTQTADFGPHANIGGAGCGRDIRAHSRRGRVRCRLTPRDV